jgi:hypothetical protein
MARNRSNRGSGPARRGREDSPARSGPGSEQKPPESKAAESKAVEGKTGAAESAKPASPAAAGSDARPSTATPPAAGPTGASTSSPSATTPSASGSAPKAGDSGPDRSTTSPAASPTAPRPAASGAAASSQTVNAHASSAASSGSRPPAQAATRPTSTASTTGGSGGGQRPPGGGGGGGSGPGARPPASAGVGRSFGAGVVGGLIGGIVIVLLSLWFQSGGDELAALRGKVDEIGSKVDEVGSRVDQVESTVANAPAAGDQMESLAERIQALESASGGDLVSRLDALQAQVESQGATQAELQAAASGTSSPDLSGRLAEIEAALAKLPSSDASQKLEQFEQRLAALESGATKAPAATGASSETAAAGQRTAELQQAVKTLQDELAKVSARLPEADQLQKTQSQVSQLEQRLSTAEQAEGQLKQLSASVDQLSQKLSAAEQADSQLKQLSDKVQQLSQQISEDQKQSETLAGQVSTLGDRVSGAESKLESAERDRTRAAALALIVGQLEAAIEEARPYQTQVQALSAMTTGDATAGDANDDAAIKQAVSELEPGAAGGVPSLATLRQSFEPVANEIVHQARAPEGDNLVSRAADNLMRLVTVRPVGGDVRGDTVEARVARAEAALGKGDLASAVAELEKLEGRPAAAAADWLTQAKARLGADQAVAQLRTQATDLLSQSH